jgi:protein-tyrosine phosphatase
MKYLKITHVINVTQHVKNKFEDRGIKYLNIAIDDTDKFKITKYFKTAFDFIEDALTNSQDTSTFYFSCICKKVGKNESSSENSKNNHNKSQYNYEYSNTPEELKENSNSNDTVNSGTLSSHSSVESITEEFMNVSLDNFQDIFANINDNNKKNKIIQTLFQRAYKKYKSDVKILIHCSMGVSRSPTIAIMYIMKKFNISCRDAVEFLKLQRQKSQPIDSFQFELEEFQRDKYDFCEEMENSIKIW